MVNWYGASHPSNLDDGHLPLDSRSTIVPFLTRTWVDNGTMIRAGSRNAVSPTSIFLQPSKILLSTSVARGVQRR